MNGDSSLLNIIIIIILLLTLSVFFDLSAFLSFSICMIDRVSSMYLLSSVHSFKSLAGDDLIVIECMYWQITFSDQNA